MFIQEMHNFSTEITLTKLRLEDNRPCDLLCNYFHRSIFVFLLFPIFMIGKINGRHWKIKSVNNFIFPCVCLSTFISNLGLLL